MVKPFTIATPRYHIRNIDGDTFDVFKRKTNAIAAAIELAIEYPDNTFLVVKTVNNKQKSIFTIKLDMQAFVMDVPDVYENIIKSFQKRLNKTKLWRKAEK